jgi:hypothetical protein
MPTIDFGRKAAADSAREEWDEYLCSGDDARMTKVTFASDTPEDVLEEIELDAADARGSTATGTGQASLTDAEKDRIDFSKGRASVPHARSVKGLAVDAGVDDWTAYYDPTLTVDEHRDVMERAARDEQGSRMDAEEDEQERAAEAARAAKNNQCDHARDHCEHGDPDACEFLKDRCGLDDDQVDQILDEDQGDPASGQLPGEAYGGLRKLWKKYRAGLGNAKEAAAGINEIRQQYGQDEISFDELGGQSITRDSLS